MGTLDGFAFLPEAGLGIIYAGAGSWFSPA